MKVLISGAGIAGLTLAKRLLMEGIRPTVIEKATRFRTMGSTVELNQDALMVLKKMGLLDEIQERKVRITKRQFLDEKGTPLFAIPLEAMQSSEIEQISIHRFAWHETLYRSVCDQIPIQFGTHIQELTEDATGVQVTFQNGEQQHFDIVIGADGIHSQTRKQLLGTEYERHEDIGYMQFSIKNATLPEHLELGVNYATFLPGFYLEFNFDENYANGLCMYPKERQSKLAKEEKKTFLMQKCQSIEWGIDQVIEQIEDPSQIYDDTITTIHLPKWWKGRTVWVGDAAHAMTFMLGTGGGKAMLGADRLVESILQSSHYQEAFSKYESLHREDVDRLQKKSIEAARYTVSDRVEDFEEKIHLLKHAPHQLHKKYSAE